MRKHLVKSAGYWFNAAKDYSTVSIGEPSKTDSERLMAMEQAYNHVENALAYILEKCPQAKNLFEKMENKN